MGKVIGIDLGTTNSAVAYLDHGQAVIIQNARGHRVTPSIVAFDKNGDVIVGEAAKNQAIINSERTIIGIKRNMGSKKAILIDNSALVIGSLNFDIFGYKFQQENIAVLRDAGVIADFCARVRDVDWATAVPAG